MAVGADRAAGATLEGYLKGKGKVIVSWTMHISTSYSRLWWSGRWEGWRSEGGLAGERLFMLFAGETEVQ